MMKVRIRMAAYGPYVQSERQAQRHLYEICQRAGRKRGSILLFLRQRASGIFKTGSVHGKEIIVYDKHCLHLSKEEVEANLAAGSSVCYPSEQPE